MTVIQHTFAARCTAEEAFDYLSDSRSELEWSPLCTEMQKLTDGPVGVGTRYRAKWKGNPPAEIEILTYDRPHMWTSISRGKVTVKYTGTVESTADGMRFTSQLEPTARGPYRLLLPVLSRLLKRSAPGAAERMRDSLERRHQDGR